MKEQKQNSLIRSIVARQIYEARGASLVEVEVITGDGSFRATCANQSGGQFEPPFVRDAGIGPKAVDKCLQLIANDLTHPLIGQSVQDQQSIDALLAELDGSPRFERFGVNTIFPISAACCLANAANQRCPLWKTIAKLADTRKCALPVPIISVFSGGVNAPGTLPFNDLSVAPVGATSEFEAIKVCQELVQDIIKQYQIKGGCENGGVAPKQLKTVEDHIESLNNAIKNAGMEGKIGISIDCRAGDFATKAPGSMTKYDLGFKAAARVTYVGTELAEYYVNLVKNYPIVSLQDPFDLEDVDSYKYLRAQLDKAQVKLQVFGDELIQSQADRITFCAHSKLVNGATLRLSQCGTVSQAINTFKSIAANGWKALVTAQLGDTVDAFAAHFAVGVSSELVKFGGLWGSERLAKYNELLRIEECGEVVYGCQDWILQ